MKYLKKKKKSHGGLIAMIVILAVLILGMVAWMMLNPARGNGEEAAAATTVPVETEAAEPVTIPVETLPEIRPANVVPLVNGEIETPYGILRYPEGLADHLVIVQASEDPYTLEFYAALEGRQDVRLFAIALGENSGGNLGMAQMESGEVLANVTIYTLDFIEGWKEDEVITVYAMQDVVNEIIEAMDPVNTGEESEQPVFVQQTGEQETVHHMEIETPYVPLYYPGRWMNNLRTEHVDLPEENMYKVHFYGSLDGTAEYHLFSIYFGGDEGDQLGAVMSADGIPVPVSLLMAEPDLTGLSDSETETLLMMQEASNELIRMIDYIQ